jgi:FkbM family methyltransferase
LIEGDFGSPARVSLRTTFQFVLGHPFNRGRRLRAINRVVRWQVLSRMFPTNAMVVPWVDDVRLLVRRSESGVTGNLYCGLHEFEDMGFALHFLRPEDLFADIGANAGTYTLLGCGAAGARGLAIEPVPGTFRRLQDHITLNDLSSRVQCRNVALGSERGTAQFTTGLDTKNRALAAGDETAGEAVTVPVERLDDLCAELDDTPSLIKIDVEGYEGQVLEGAATTLKSPALFAAIVELNGSGDRYGSPDSDVYRRLRDAGFSLMAYDPWERRLTPRQRPARFDGNGIFVRDVDAAKERCRSAPRHQVLGCEL